MNGKKSRRIAALAFKLSTKPKKYYVHKETGQVILEPKCVRGLKQYIKRNIALFKSQGI